MLTTRWPALVLVATLLAGCTAGVRPALPPAIPPPEPSLPSTESEPVADAPGATSIEVASTIRSPGLLAPDQEACDAAGCARQYSEVLYATGRLEGTLVERGRSEETVGGARVLAGTQTFAGVIDGCGAGRVTLAFSGAEADGAGEIALALAPGTATTGFRGLVALELVESYSFDPASHSLIGSLSGRATCISALVPALPPSREGTSPIAVDARFDTDGSLLVDSARCGPEEPGGCTSSGHLYWTVSGSWSGTIVDYSHEIHSGDGTLVEGFIERVFTGSIPGCGSGTLDLVGYGVVDDQPSSAQPGAFQTREELTLLPGSGTNGFEGVVAAELFPAYDVSFVPLSQVRGGAIVGTVWCAPPAAVAPREDGAPLAVEGTFDSAGFSRVEQTVCEPTRPGVCQITATELLDATGDLVGTFVDNTRLHFLPDASMEATAARIFTGSLAACGSGTLTFQLAGHVTNEPDPSQPGKMHFVEPPMLLVPGSTTNGLARVLDAELSLDYLIGADGAIEGGSYAGTVWCAATVE